MWGPVWGCDFLRSKDFEISAYYGFYYGGGGIRTHVALPPRRFSRPPTLTPTEIWLVWFGGSSPFFRRSLDGRVSSALDDPAARALSVGTLTAGPPSD